MEIKNNRVGEGQTFQRLFDQYGPSMGYVDIKGYFDYPGLDQSFVNLVNRSQEPFFAGLRQARFKFGKRVRFKTEAIAQIIDGIGNPASEPSQQSLDGCTV
jgi:hypothetical protein